MQEKFDKLFGSTKEDYIDIENIIEELKINRKRSRKMEFYKYKTKRYFRQILLSNIEGIKITDIERVYNEEKEETEKIITFEFTELQKEEVDEIIQACQNEKYKDVRLDNFAELKRKRKQLIEEHYKRKNDEL
jgi:hypothetical protein